MTIDKARRYLRLMLSGMKYEEGLTQIKEDKEIELLNIEAVKVALDTMSNYQKIQEIMCKEYTDENMDVCFVQRLVEIREVLEHKPNYSENPNNSTTKNDLPHCQCTDAEIAKSFIEEVGAVKDHLSCGQMMDFPNTFDEFAEDYGFKDKDEIYTNGSELIPVFRVKQWLEHISTTKNDLGVDCISRKSVIDELKRYFHDEYYQRTSIQDCRDCFIEDVLNHLPSVTPQEPRWIPVSERLPKAGEYVGNVAKYYLVQNEYGDMMVARYTHSEYWEQMYHFKPIADEIIAWRELPQPYIAESEEVNENS